MSNPIQAPPTQSWVRAKDGVLLGVCQGLARQFDVNPWVIRLMWMISVFCFGVGFLMYFVVALAFPREDKTPQKMILGVCWRISQRGEVELGLARLIALLLLFFSCGAALVGYIVLYFLLPEPTKELPTH